MDIDKKIIKVLKLVSAGKEKRNTDFILSMAHKLDASNGQVVGFTGHQIKLLDAIHDHHYQ